MNLRKICAVLGQRHTMEIVVTLRCGGNKNMKQIAQDTGIAYTTVQKRVTDMERAGIVTTWFDVDRRTGKNVRIVKVKEFKHMLSPLTIKEYLEAEGG